MTSITPTTATLTRHGASSQPLRFSAQVYVPPAGTHSRRPAPSLVLCLHGFPDTPQTFVHQARALAEAGYTVVAPTMRGYEPSSQPESSAYYIADLAEDVVAWIDALEADKVHVVGHDWGAVAGYGAAALAPGRLRTLTALSVPPLHRYFASALRTPDQFLRSWYMALFQIPGLAESMIRWRDFGGLRVLIERWALHTPGLTDTIMSEIRAAFRREGVVEAALGYYRCLANVSSPRWRESWQLTKQPIPVPTLVLYGKDDPCITHRMYHHAIRPELFTKGVTARSVAEAGHFVHREQAETVNAHLLTFIGAHAPMQAA